MSKTKIEQIIDTWTDAEKDEAYRYLWLPYVIEDVENCLEWEYDLEDYKEEDIKGIIESVADSYVYQGEYDCNLTYWRNIQNLIDGELELLEEE